ncbi:hypothetical protein BASA61_000981 [Batrachochytrium salamandrivorans]|nr:hypothetical protein BASA61_000981 [Batrachochytrium salamandrivorans]
MCPALAGRVVSPISMSTTHHTRDMYHFLSSSPPIFAAPSVMLGPIPHYYLLVTRRSHQYDKLAAIESPQSSGLLLLVQLPKQSTSVLAAQKVESKTRPLPPTTRLAGANGDKMLLIKTAWSSLQRNTPTPKATQGDGPDSIPTANTPTNPHTA